MIVTALIVSGFLLLVAICRIFSWDWLEAFLYALVAVLVLTIVAVVYGIVQHEKSPDLVTLKKNDWRCGQSHRETNFVMAGTILVPVTHDVCDVYVRIK